MKSFYKVLSFCFGAMLVSASVVNAQCENPPQLSITEDYTHYCQNDELSVEVTDALETSCASINGNYTYCYDNNESTVFSYCADEPGDGSVFELFFNSGTVESGWDTIDIYDGPDGTGNLITTLDGDLSGLSFLSVDGCLSFVLTTDGSISCQGGNQIELNYDITCFDVDYYYDFSWEPAELLENPNSANPILPSLESDQEFTVSVAFANDPGCVSTASVMVTAASDYQFGEDTSIGQCSVDDPIDMVLLLDGEADAVGSWTDLEGNAVLSEFDPAADQGGTFYYSYEFCPERGSELEIFVVDPPVLSTEDLTMNCENELMSVNINGYDGVCSPDAGNYSYCYDNFEAEVFTYCPGDPESAYLTLEFISGFMETNYDYITVFDGPDTESPILETFDGNVEGLTYTANNASGCITFLLESDFSISCATGQMPLLQWEVSCTETVPEFIINWNNEEFLNDANSQITELNGLTEDMTFTVEVAPIIEPGCISTADVMVTFANNINLGNDTDLNVCYGDDQFNLIDALDGDPGDLGTWFDGLGNEITDANFNPTLDGSQIFTYSYEGCTNSSELNIQVIPLPNVNAGADILICEGQTITLQASGAQSYEWEGLGEQPIEVSPVETTTYSVTGYNVFGCSATDEITVSVETNPIAEITLTDGVLSVEGGAAWQWYVDGLPILGAANQTYTPLAPGTYYVIINAGSECEITSEPFIVTGIAELIEKEIQIYPQPFDHTLTINSPVDILQIRIFDLNGRMVFDNMINSSLVKINPDLPSGSYILELNFADHSLRKALIKQ